MHMHTKVVWLIVTAFTYYVTQEAKYMWIWLSVHQPLKLLSIMLILPCTADWNHIPKAMVISCICVVGLLFTPPLKSLPGNHYQVCVILDHIHHVLIQVTTYKICKILFKQIDSFVYKLQLLLCVDIIINKCGLNMCK